MWQSSLQLVPRRSNSGCPGGKKECEIKRVVLAGGDGLGKHYFSTQLLFGIIIYELEATGWTYNNDRL